MPRGIPRPYSPDGSNREQIPRDIDGFRLWLERYLSTAVPGAGVFEGDLYTDVSVICGDRFNNIGGTDYYEQACQITFSMRSGLYPVAIWLSSESDGVRNDFDSDPDWLLMEFNVGYTECKGASGEGQNEYIDLAEEVIAGHTGFGSNVFSIGSGNLMDSGYDGPHDAYGGVYLVDPADGKLTVGLMRRCYKEGGTPPTTMDEWTPTISFSMLGFTTSVDTFPVPSGAMPEYP